MYKMVTDKKKITIYELIPSGVFFTTDTQTAYIRMDVEYLCTKHSCTLYYNFNVVYCFYVQKTTPI